MIKKENLCVDCTALGMPCRGISCPYYKPVEVHCCDRCGDVLDEVYKVDGEELRDDCLKEMFRKE